VAQLVNAVCDSSGFCQFLQPALDDMRLFYSYLYGEDVTREQIADYGWHTLQDEWEFNRRAGFKEEDDRLPEYMKEEGIGPENAVFAVSPEIIHQAKERLPLSDRLFTTKATG
jgi:aldehyde:ferredoxin oxidoreductase